MAESSSQQKTEKPTAKRLREARKQGQVPRSRELSTAFVVAAGIGVLMSSGQNMMVDALRFMHDSLDLRATLLSDPKHLPILFAQALTAGLMIVAPVLMATLVAAFAAPAVLGGFHFSGEGFQPKFSRLNPLSGIQRIFSTVGLSELVKGVLKTVLIGWACGWFLWSHRDALAALSFSDQQAAIASIGALCGSMLKWSVGMLILIAAIDAPYQRWNVMRQLKMTRQEVLDEHKESEGRPEVKAKIRRLQAEMSRRRMMSAVPTADVVVTNPTHYAVALKYAAGKMRAPTVVAKGRDEIARTIRELAREHRIPTVSAPPLARALYRQVGLDQEIPAALYSAVAQVLTYVMQLRHWRGGPPPTLGEMGEVPGGEPDAER